MATQTLTEKVEEAFENFYFVLNRYPDSFLEMISVNYSLVTDYEPESVKSQFRRTRAKFRLIENLRIEFARRTALLMSVSSVAGAVISYFFFV